MIFSIFIITCSMAMMLSILTYKRGECTFKRHINILAAMLCILAGFNVVRIFYLNNIFPFSFMECVWVFLCTLAIVRNKGNVSFLIYGKD